MIFKRGSPLTTIFINLLIRFLSEQQLLVAEINAENTRTGIAKDISSDRLPIGDEDGQSTFHESDFQFIDKISRRNNVDGKLKSPLNTDSKTLFNVTLIDFDVKSTKHHRSNRRARRKHHNGYRHTKRRKSLLQGGKSKTIRDENRFMADENLSKREKIRKKLVRDIIDNFHGKSFYWPPQKQTSARTPTSKLLDGDSKQRDNLSANEEYSSVETSKSKVLYPNENKFSKVFNRTQHRRWEELKHSTLGLNTQPFNLHNKSSSSLLRNNRSSSFHKEGNSLHSSQFLSISEANQTHYLKEISTIKQKKLKNLPNFTTEKIAPIRNESFLRNQSQKSHPRNENESFRKISYQEVISSDAKPLRLFIMKKAGRNNIKIHESSQKGDRNELFLQGNNETASSEFYVEGAKSPAGKTHAALLQKSEIPFEENLNEFRDKFEDTFVDYSPAATIKGGNNDPCYGIRDLLLVVLMTSLVNLVAGIVVTFAFCCLPLRERCFLAYSTKFASQGCARKHYEEDTSGSVGCLEACLPDISYQRHLARGFTKGRAFGMAHVLQQLTGVSEPRKMRKDSLLISRRSLSLEDLSIT